MRLVPRPRTVVALEQDVRDSRPAERQYARGGMDGRFDTKLEGVHRAPDLVDLDISRGIIHALRQLGGGLCKRGVPIDRRLDNCVGLLVRCRLEINLGSLAWRARDAHDRVDDRPREVRSHLVGQRVHERGRTAKRLVNEHLRIGSNANSQRACRIGVGGRDRVLAEGADGAYARQRVEEERQHGCRRGPCAKQQSHSNLC